MRTPMELVAEFYRAIGEGDKAGLRAILARDFWFRGPIMSFGDPDTFADAMMKLPFKATFEDSRFIADGLRVAHVFRWKVMSPAPAEIPMCEILTTSEGKLASSELFVDTKLLRGVDALARVSHMEREVGRVRRVLAEHESKVTERKMFGGTTFLLSGNMLCTVSAKGLMVRVGKDADEAALALPYANPCLGAGRRMAGFVLIEPDGVRDDRQLEEALELATRYVRELPAKSGRARPVAPAGRGRSRGRHPKLGVRNGFTRIS